MPTRQFLEMTFSTNALPERQRIPVWRELFGRTLLGVDIEPLPDVPFIAKATLQSLPGLGIISGVMAGAHIHRTREMLADGNDDLTLALNVAAKTGSRSNQVSRVRQRGQEVIVSPGEGILMTNAEACTFTCSQGRFVGLRIPRPALTPLTPEIDRAVMRLIPRDHEALTLLRNYLGALSRLRPSGPPQLQRLFASHIHDLAALAITAREHKADLGSSNGVRAARLRAIKIDIINSLANQELSVAMIARLHRISAVYVRKLFAGESMTFSEFVMQHRLARAYRMLGSPRSERMPISDIAFEAGFSDLSYFSRSFRRRYGISPSDARTGRTAGDD
jgi:AraC-like DNA-binding protein